MKDKEGVESARYMGKILAKTVQAINNAPKGKNSELRANRVSNRQVSHLDR